MADEADNVVDMVTQRALSDVLSTYDDEEHDPDKAAKAIQLSRLTGVPSPVIHEDQDRFMQDGKQALAHGIVSNNPYIQDYIMAHPLAAKVSSDDWGPLDTAMNTGLKYASKSILQKTFEGFKENADYEQFEGEMKEFDNLLANNPYFGSIFYQQVLRSDVHDIGKAFRTISGLFGAASGGLGEFAYQSGIPDWFQKHLGDPMLTGEAGKNRLIRDTLVALQTSLSGQEGPAGPGIKPRADALKIYQEEVGKQIRDGLTITDANGRVYPPELIKPYLLHGEEPPVGLHPEIDKVKGEQSRLDAKWLSEYDSAVQSTATQGRSPEMSELAARQVVGDQTIELDAGAIRKLYGGKPPTLDDGLLGWVPDLQTKLDLAQQTGGDIEVPLASWIARTDPEVKRELKDFIRVRPDGMSPAERELYKGYDEAVKSSEIKPPLSSGDHIVDGIRSAAGLDSVFDPDRAGKLTLERREQTVEDIIPGSGKGSYFNLNDSAGNNIGDLTITEQMNGKRLYVNWIGAGPKIGPKEFATRVPTPLYLGPRVIRDLLTQIKNEFPNAEELSGFRTTGARGIASGGEGGPASISIKSPSALSRKELSDFAQQLREIFAGPEEPPLLRKIVHGGTEVLYKPTELYTQHEQQLVAEIGQLLDRIVPKGVEKHTGVKVSSLDERIPIEVKGMYDRPHDPLIDSAISVAINFEDPIGVARHEAIHHLRQRGFFTDKEWQTLEAAADRNNWVNRWGMAERYAKVPDADVMEETIAEAYRKWGANPNMIDKSVHPIMEKIDRFIKEIGAIIQRILGTLDAAHIFEKVERGEVGAREPTGKPAEGLPEPAIDPDDLIHRAASTVELPSDEMMRDAGLTDYEIRQQKRDPDPTKMRQIREGYTYIQGSWKKITPEVINEWKGYLAKAEEDLKANQQKLTEMFAKEDFPRGASSLIGSDWQTGFGNLEKPADYKAAAFSALERRRDSTQRQLAKYERVLQNAQGIIKSAAAKEPELPQAGTTRMEERRPIEAKAINLSERALSSILKAINDRADEQWEQHRDKLEKDEVKRQSKEWKDNAAAMREDVEREVYQRDDIGADQLIRKGVLDGIRVKGKIPKIDPQFLTPAQRAKLPKDYFAKKGEGFHIDDFARLFKFDSGDALVERLAMLEEGRKQSGLEGKAFIDQLIKDTTNLRMEEKYGDMKANAIQEARDKFVGDKDLRVIHEEILGIQEAIGDQRTITKDKLEEGIQTAFNNRIASQVKAKKELRDAGKLDKAATTELFVNKNPSGFLSNKMGQYKAIYQNGLASKLEKEWDRFQDTLKNLKPRSSDTMDQGYRNIIHDLMYRLGEQPKRIPGDLSDSMAKLGVGNNLAEFKLKTYDKTWGMDDLQIPEFLADPNFRKDLKDLTVEEFRGVRDTINALAKKGRASHTLEVAGEKLEKEKAIDELIQGRVDRFPFQPHEATPSRSSRLLKLPRAYLAGSTAFETFARRMDQKDPYGPWMRYLVYPLAKAANYKDVLLRRYAEQLSKVGPINDFRKQLESPPLGVKVSNFTVDNLQTMIHNMGNADQWEHFARGWGADPDVLKQWVFNQAAKLDGLKEGWGKELFDRAQRMGDEVWEKAFAEAKAEYMDIYGNFPQGIEIKPIQTPYGEMKGWYHPQIPDAKQKIIFDKDGKVVSKQSEKQGEPSLYDNNDNFHARTFNGYTKRRTGAFYPMSLDSQMIPVRLTQMLHDIAFRKTLIETEKLLTDKRLQDAVSHHYGDEYAKGFMPYLRGIAGQEGIPSEAMADAMRLSEFLRQNVISSYIAFNPYTAMKHGPGALVMSAWQVGLFPFLRFRRPGAMGEMAPKEWLEAAKDLYGHQMDMNLTNKEFVDRWSEEVGRRRRFWQETIGGQTKLNTNQVGMFNGVFSRDNIMQKGSWLVAQSDMFSVRPTWLAAYREAMLDTKNNHELSVSVADAAVRLQHGSTAITNLPAIIRSMGKNPLGGWLTSIFGFWGTIMQRRIEIAHQIADTYRMDISDKQFGQAYKNSAEILAKTMVYVVWPAIVEEYVTGLTTDDRRGWGAHLTDMALHGLGASGIGIREISQLFRGHESFGLISSFLHDTSKTLRSLAKGEEIFNRKNAGETVQNILTTFGQLTGKVPKAVASAARYGLDLFTEQQQPPEDVSEAARGITKGTPRARILK